MIDAGVEAELLHHVAAFVRPACDADGTRAFGLGYLADDRADSAGCGRHHNGLAGLRAPDLVEPGVGRHPRHAEHAERGRHRRDRRIDLAQALAVGQRVALPAARAQHDVADVVAGLVGLNDLGDGAALHHAADLDRLGIGRRVAHAAAHIGIERQVERPQQHIWPGPRCRDTGNMASNAQAEVRSLWARRRVGRLRQDAGFGTWSTPPGLGS